MVPSAYLRVFEPLEAFPEPERRHWERYVSEGGGVSTRTALRSEEHATATAVVRGRSPVPDDDALVRRVDGRVFLCPIQLELRSSLALLSFRETLPAEVVDAFVAPDEAVRAASSLSNAPRLPHIRSASWTVPLDWFAAFSPSQRHVVDPPEGRGPRLTYLSWVEAAVGLLDRATGIVATNLDEGDDLVASLSELSTWLEDFDTASVVELDYASLAPLIGREQLVQDQSCEQVWNALECLDAGDLTGAAAEYGALRARWSELRAKAQCS